MTSDLSSALEVPTTMRYTDRHILHFYFTYTAANVNTYCPLLKVMAKGYPHQKGGMSPASLAVARPTMQAAGRVNWRTGSQLGRGREHVAT